jgi:transposase
MPGRSDEVTEKQTRARYTAEFKLEALRQVRAGRSASDVAKALGMPKASLTNWVRDESKGRLPAAGQGKSAQAAVVSPEQEEISRLRAEVARLKMERDIAKKAAAYFALDVLQSTPGSNR